MGRALDRLHTLGIYLLRDRDRDQINAIPSGHGIPFSTGLALARIIFAD